MNSSSLRFFIAILLLSASFGFAADQDGAVIKIVSSLPRTGSARGQTDTIVNGIQMAIEESGHKIGAFTIKYEDLDDATAAEGQWTAEKEAANADQAIKDPDVMVYIGTYNSGAAKVSMPKLNQAGLLMVSPANTWPGLTKPGKGDPGEPEKYRPSGKINYVRCVPADDIQGVVSAEWAKKLGLLKVFILDDREVYGKGIADLFQARAEEIGLKVLGHEGIDAKAQEFKPLMTKIKAAGPQLIYFGGTTQTKAGQLVKDMLAVGLDAKFMCPDGCFEDAFIESAGAENLQDRALVTFGGLPPEKLTGKGAAFVANYQKKGLRLRVRQDRPGGDPPRGKEGPRCRPRRGPEHQELRRRARQMVLRQERRYDAPHHERQHRQGREVRLHGRPGRGLVRGRC